MNVVPLAMALPYQVGIQSPAEEHFRAAFLREEIVEKMRGNGLIEIWSPRADSNRRPSPYQGSAGGPFLEWCSAEIEHRGYRQ